MVGCFSPQANRYSEWQFSTCMDSSLLCRQNRLPIPPRPSRYLIFSSAHRRCTTGVLLVDVGARSPLTACTFKWFDPAKCFLTWYMLSDERSAPQLHSFLVGGCTLSTASDRQRACQPSLHVSITRAPLYILFLGPYTSVYYAHIIMTSWLVVGSQVKAIRGIASGKLVTVAPWTCGYNWGEPERAPH